MDRFEVYSVQSGNFDELAKIFGSLLQSKGMESGVPRHLPLVNTIKHLCNLGASTILLQKDVQDPDFLAEHSAYYSKWSYKVPRYCKRLHFFSRPTKHDVPLDVVDEMVCYSESYLGFVTLRPISVSPQAATILKPPVYVPCCYILSKDKFTVNIAGQKFTIDGTPFMQQDNAVGACAQASIWMALRTLRRKEGVSAFSPAQITDAATRFYVKGRTLPNRGGLAVEQVTEAIRAAGYSPHIIPLKANVEDKGDTNNIRRSVYPYIESGIPVLLILFKKHAEGHAVLLVGHGWDYDPNELVMNAELKFDGGDKTIQIVDASTWVNPFYIHNDNTGPYIQLLDTCPDNYSLEDASFAIPFLPQDVFIDADEAKVTCLKLLDWVLKKNGSNEADSNQDHALLTKMVTRTYLQDRSNFRAAVINGDMPEDVKKYYRNKWLPRRVWVTEISLFEGYKGAPERSAVRIGEIVLDPLSEPEDGCFLTIHLCKELIPDEQCGVIVDRNPFDGGITAFKVSGEKYCPLIRE